MAGIPVIEVAGAEQIGEHVPLELLACLRIGERRMQEASVEYEFNALVEVALRALSPGINDPFTAKACVDRLADALQLLLERDGSVRIRADHKGDTRVIFPEEPFARYLDLAFGAVAACAEDQEIVLTALKDVLAQLEAISSRDRVTAEIARFREHRLT